MLRRLVLAPALVALALGTASPATAAEEDYEVLCVNVTIILELDLPGDVGKIPEICVPIIVPLPDPL